MGWPLTSAATMRPRCVSGAPSPTRETQLGKSISGSCTTKAVVSRRTMRAALIWYRKAADQGNAYAQNNLAVFYSEGRGGLPKDDREAARLYKLAADQGNAYAQANLGDFYEQGRGGLPKDEREAARLYKLAADQGNAYAQARIEVRKVAEIEHLLSEKRFDEAFDRSIALTERSAWKCGRLVASHPCCEGAQALGGGTERCQRDD